LNIPPYNLDVLPMDIVSKWRNLGLKIRNPSKGGANCSSTKAINP